VRDRRAWAAYRRPRRRSGHGEIRGCVVVAHQPASGFAPLAGHSSLARFWRNLGAAGTYGALSLPVAALTWGIIRLRDRLLAIDYGTHYPLVFLAVLCAAGGRDSHRPEEALDPGILVGIPELSPNGIRPSPNRGYLQQDSTSPIRGDPSLDSGLCIVLELSGVLCWALCSASRSWS